MSTNRALWQSSCIQDTSLKMSIFPWLHSKCPQPKRSVWAVPYVRILTEKALLIITGLVQSPLKLIESLDTVSQNNHNRTMGKKYLLIIPRQIFSRLWLESETAAESKSRNQFRRPHCEETAERKAAAKLGPKNNIGWLVVFQDQCREKHFKWIILYCNSKLETWRTAGAQALSNKMHFL